MFSPRLLLLRCPKEVYPHVPTVISICLRYLTYDPNYNFDDEDEDDNAMDAEQNDEDYQGTESMTPPTSDPRETNTEPQTRAETVR